MNCIEYANQLYPVKTLTATIDDGRNSQPREYVISIEGLHRVLEDDIENDVQEAIDVDNAIYYYVDNNIFNESDEYIAKHGLDTPMTLVDSL